MYFRDCYTDEIVPVTRFYELSKKEDDEPYGSLFECTAMAIAYTFKGVSDYSFVFFTYDELHRIFDKCIAKRKRIEKND